MIFTEKYSVPFLQFPNLIGFEHIRHGIFTRKGGFSTKPYNSLNTDLSVGDDRETVRRNREAVSMCMGDIPIFFPRQVHGTDILILKNEDEMIPDAEVPADAVITNRPGLNIGIQTADCQAVLMYDPKSRAAANVHSGWRGSIQNIIGLTVRNMSEAFGTDPRNIHAGIGPSLGPCCAEFINYPDEIPEIYWKYKDETHHFNFWAVTRDQLMAAGVPGENICISSLCTRCRTDLFFSYRGEGITGRFAAVIGPG
jgi:hypothetical protein